MDSTFLRDIRDWTAFGMGAVSLGHGIVSGFRTVSESKRLEEFQSEVLQRQEALSKRILHITDSIAYLATAADFAQVAKELEMVRNQMGHLHALYAPLQQLLRRQILVTAVNPAPITLISQMQERPWDLVVAPQPLTPQSALEKDNRVPIVFMLKNQWMRGWQNDSLVEKLFTVNPVLPSISQFLRIDPIGATTDSEILLREGRYREALDAIEMGLYSKPNFEPLHNQMVTALFECGEYKRLADGVASRSIRPTSHRALMCAFTAAQQLDHGDALAFLASRLPNAIMSLPGVRSLVRSGS